MPTIIKTPEFATNYTIEDGVTFTMLSKWCSCRQKSQFELDGWRKKGPVKSSLYFGTLIHKALEEHYRSGEFYMDFLDVWLNEAETEQEMLDIAKAKILLPRYFEYWKEQDSKMAFVSAEEVFDTKFYGVRLRGKRDAVLKARKKYWLFETKTSSRISEDELSAKLRFDGQINHYSLTWEIENHPKKLAGVLYNVIRNPGIKIENLEKDIDKRPEYYFLRRSVVLENDIKERYRHELRRKLMAFRRWSQGKELTYRNEGACFGRFTCEFVNACATGEMFEYEIARVPFEELEV